MTYVSVRRLVGENAVTLEDGNTVFSQIHKPLEIGEVVELDFEGVEVYSSPFFNAAIGRLLADLSADTLNQLLKLVNLSPLGDRILRRVIENAQDYFHLSPEKRQAVADDIGSIAT